MPKICNKYSQKKNCAALVPISTFTCLWAIYIFPRSVCLFYCRKIRGPILGIYKSLTDTWMWKLGLRPHNSFSGNTWMGFSLHCVMLQTYCIIQFLVFSFSCNSSSGKLIVFERIYLFFLTFSQFVVCSAKSSLNGMPRWESNPRLKKLLLNSSILCFTPRETANLKG